MSETAVQAIRSAIPESGLFQDREWMISPQPLALGPELLNTLSELGPALLRFLRACNSLYLQSARGEAPPWIAELLDRGKPAELIEIARSAALHDAVPDVIRPDLILTEDGFAISEIDSVPGGIGATAWMNETYSALGHEIIGGARGMQRSFAHLLSGGEVIVSDESADYLPEMRWLAENVRNSDTDPAFSVKRDSEVDSENLRPGQTLYRFFELFDLANVSGSGRILEATSASEITLTSPPKPFLEEKLWLALFWSPSLRSYWQEALGGADAFLRKHIPFGWVVDPEPLPHFAEYPKLGINTWEQLGEFGKAERQLVLKISGFSERAWGSRGVFIGHDLPRDAWSEAIHEAIESFPTNPYVLQEFHKAKSVKHPIADEDNGDVTDMKGRVRLCPYYFVDRDRAEATNLSGVMATVAPADKKIIHGMRDAAIVPCVV